MASASLILDKRRETENGYPVKVEIYHAGKQYKVSTRVYTTIEIYNHAFNGKTRSASALRLRDKLIEQRQKAQAILDNMNGVFELDKFKRMFYSEIEYQTKGSALYIKDLYQQRIIELERLGKYKHAKGFDSSLKSLLEFKPSLSLQEVTPEFLHDYQHWMLGKECSISTVYTYLRPLRTVFTKAIADKLISADALPFGRGKYSIGNSDSARLALYPEDIKKFWDYVPANDAQQRAKDMWFFSFYANGMAPVDMLHLTKENMEGDNIAYKRRKTRFSTKKSITVYIHLNDDIKAILQRQGSGALHPYVFPILKKGMSAKEQFQTVEKWRSQQNRILRRIAAKLGLKSACVYAARHSFAGMLGMAELNVKTVSELLGDSTPTMGLNYMGDGRPDKVKKLAPLLTAFKDL